MDFGTLLHRTWNIVWEHKFLIILGILVALGSGSGMRLTDSRNNNDYDQPGGGFTLPTPRPGEEMPARPEMPGLPNLRQMGLPVANIILVLFFGGLALLLGLVIWSIATIARGGLIAGVSTIDAGGISSFSAAWQAGWRKGWQLLGISILPAIPAFFLALAGLFSFATTAVIAGPLGVDVTGLSLGLGSLLSIITGVFGPLSVILGLAQSFANRACMLEGLGVLAAYQRGLSVMFANLGQALLLFVIQVVLSIGVGLAMILPGILMALCCVLWPIFIVIQGVITAYFSTLWTLAWREWTGESPDV